MMRSSFLLSRPASLSLSLSLSRCVRACVRARVRACVRAPRGGSYVLPTTTRYEGEFVQQAQDVNDYLSRSADEFAATLNKQPNTKLETLRRIKTALVDARPISFEVVQIHSITLHHITSHYISFEVVQIHSITLHHITSRSR